MINPHPSEYIKQKRKPGIVAPGVDTTNRQKKLMQQNKKHYSRLKERGNVYRGRYSE